MKLESSALFERKWKVLIVLRASRTKRFAVSVVDSIIMKLLFWGERKYEV
jgi:hypothetical protein